MFQFDVPETHYVDPWDTPFGERFAKLASGRRRVAYFYEQPDNSTFRYRVYNMIQALQKTDITASYFHAEEIEHLPKVAELSDVLVICRSRYTSKLDHVVTQARNNGKRVFFDVDDFVFDPSYALLLLETLDQDLNHPDVWDFWFAYMGRIGGAMRLCERVITTNEYLAEMIRRYTNQPVSVIPNFLNREQLDISAQIFEQKQQRGFSTDDKIHVGYFSGTPTHNRDFEIVSDALVDILDAHPEVHLTIVGFIEFKESLRKFESRIEFYPLQDFINLQRLIGTVEVNVVPLQDNVFTNCKSELKYFEAGIVGTVSIASPVFTYVNAIRNGENGYLAKSYEWRDKIESVLGTMDIIYPAMAEKACQESLERYSWYNQSDLIVRTLLE